jgi:hypothetical protein
MKGLFMIKKFWPPYTPNTVKLGTVHLEPAEVTAIALLINPWSAAHPDITHPDYTEDEVKMELLKATINVVLSITRGVRRDYV